MQSCVHPVHCSGLQNEEDDGEKKREEEREMDEGGRKMEEEREMDDGGRSCCCEQNSRRLIRDTESAVLPRTDSDWTHESGKKVRCC